MWKHLNKSMKLKTSINDETKRHTKLKIPSKTEKNKEYQLTQQYKEYAQIINEILYREPRNFYNLLLRNFWKKYKINPLTHPLPLHLYEKKREESGRQSILQGLFHDHEYKPVR